VCSSIRNKTKVYRFCVLFTLIFYKYLLENIVVYHYVMTCIPHIQFTTSKLLNCSIVRNDYHRRYCLNSTILYMFSVYRLRRKQLTLRHRYLPVFFSVSAVSLKLNSPLHNKCLLRSQIIRLFFAPRWEFRSGRFQSPRRS